MWKIRGSTASSIRLAQLLFLIALCAVQVGCGGGSAATVSTSSRVTPELISRQLAALPCPPGVTLQLWNALTGELREQLVRRASAEELVAGPPLDEPSKVDDLNAAGDPPGSIRLRWSYKNTGDYDQNSETNISDLTPIGRHFNKTPSGADWPVARVADGDLNHEVNISDVTPIGRSYLQTVTGYRVEYNASGAPGSEFSEFGAVSFNSGQRDPNGWLRFDATFANPQSGYYRVVPYYNGERGIAGDPVYFAANQPPTAVLIADTQVGESPLTVHFDASESSDPEHAALTYSWDWEGDGVVDYESGATALVEHEYTDLGDYAPRVFVRDNAGAEATDGLMVYCHEWEMYPVTEVFSNSAPQVIDGKPIFLYRVWESMEPLDKSINYARSRVAVPASADDWALMRVVPAEQQTDSSWLYPSNNTSAFMVAGRPAFVYTMSAFGNIKQMYLAHATTPEPEAQGDWERNLISDDPLEFSPSIDAISIDGTVYIVVSSARGTDIVLLYRSLSANPTGPADWEVTEICHQGANEHIQPNADVEYISGKLCIAVNQMDDMQVDYATTSNLAPQGPEDWDYMVVDTTGEILSGPEICGVSIGEVPFIVSDQDQSMHPEAIRTTSAFTSTPVSSADWTGTTQLGDSYQVGGYDPTPTGSVCAVFAVRRFEVDPKETLVIYPPRPGIAGLSAPDWVVEPFDPQISDSVSEQPGEMVQDWIFDTVPVLEGSVWKLHFARCRTKAHYTLW